MPYAAGGAEQSPTEAAPPSWCGRGYDVAYLPRVGYTTGHLDVHDLAWERHVDESLRDSHPVAERPASLVVPPSGGPDRLKPALQTPVAERPGHVGEDPGRLVFVNTMFGYLRGLSFVGKYAVVTLSKPRHASFHGLALDDELQRRGAQPQCGLQVIDLETGAIGFQNNEIERLLIVGAEEPLLTHSVVQESK